MKYPPGGPSQPIQALAKLSTDRRIVLLHYAPVRATVEGEPPEIFPFLGSTRLEEPINRFRVSACFHGHAHNGTVEGATAWLALSARMVTINSSSMLTMSTAPR